MTVMTNQTTKPVLAKTKLSKQAAHLRAGATASRQTQAHGNATCAWYLTKQIHTNVQHARVCDQVMKTRQLKKMKAKPIQGRVLEVADLHSEVGHQLDLHLDRHQRQQQAAFRLE